MKKIAAFGMCLALAFCMALPCFAQGTVQQETYSVVQDLGDGVTVVTTIGWNAAGARSTKTGSITNDYYYWGSYAGSATLNGGFYYDGSTSRATGANGYGSSASGWTYSGQSTWTSGRTAYLQASLSNGSKTVPVSLSLTCDANGNLS